MAVVGTICEVRDAAVSDLRDRMRRVELGKDAGLCPTLYRVWDRGVDGTYCTACEIADIV